jgi:hypothetical protein
MLRIIIGDIVGWRFESNNHRSKKETGYFFIKSSLSLFRPL